MKPVKLTLPLLIEATHHEAAEVVMLPDVRAAELLRLGHAEEHDGNPKVANPNHNPLADVIDPLPPGGAAINPADAMAPNILDNPGLKKLAEISTVKRKNAKVAPEAIVEGDRGGQAEALGPATTADELVAEPGPTGGAR